MSLLPLFQWCDDTAIGAAIRGSRWLFPAIEAVHLLGLTSMLGTVLVLDLRLMGIGLRRQPVSRVAAELSNIAMYSLFVMLVSGGVLFLSEALKCYANPPFRAKMMLLLLAILFHFTTVRAITRGNRAEVSPRLTRLVGAVSLTLWMSVALAGRAIGYY